ncbi:MAG: hypothetical protein WAK26_09710, partial [Terracidiphilus sp.]
EMNLEPLLNRGLGNLFNWMAEEAGRRGIEIHWATAWQMYQAADALIHGRNLTTPSGVVETYRA